PPAAAPPAAASTPSPARKTPGEPPLTPLDVGATGSIPLPTAAGNPAGTTPAVQPAPRERPVPPLREAPPEREAATVREVVPGRAAPLQPEVIGHVGPVSEEEPEIEVVSGDDETAGDGRPSGIKEPGIGSPPAARNLESIPLSDVSDLESAK